MTNKQYTSWKIAYFVIMAVIIIYGIFVVKQMDKMAPWTDNLFAVFVPIAILAGIEFFISTEIWEEHKRRKDK